MPRVDAVGISSAGIYINDRTMTASLFLKVPKALYDSKVKVLADEYAELSESIEIFLPDEKSRRIGQSAAAASLPDVS